MGIWKDGYPIVNPSRPYNPVAAMDRTFNAETWNNNGYHLREGWPVYTPRLGRYYATNRLSSAAGRVGLIIRYDSAAWSPFTWERLSNCSPLQIVGHQTPVLRGNGVLVAQDAISISNGYQWIEPNRTISTDDGVFILPTETKLYHIAPGATSDCYRCDDCTVENGIESSAVWSNVGTITWTYTMATVRLLKSGTRLIAIGIESGNTSIEIMVSDDDGATWTSKYTLSPGGSPTTFFGNPRFVQRGTDSVLILIREGRISAIPPETDIVTIDTTDNGDNWSRTVAKSFTGATVGTWSSFLWIDASTWLMTASLDFQDIAPETIIRTTDGGANWSEVYDTAGGSASGSFHNYGFEIDTAVRASDGRILNVYSEDDGATWNEIETGFSTVSGRPDWFAGMD